MTANGTTDRLRKLAEEKGQTVEQVVSRCELQQKVSQSPGCSLVHQVIQLGERMAGLIDQIQTGHGPGSGSPLARWCAEFAPGFWTDLAGVRWNLDVASGLLGNDIPAPARAGGRK